MAVHKKYANKNALGRGLDDIAAGRGLDALIDTSAVRTGGSSNLCEIAIDEIEPNANQPRREFDEEALAELARSIAKIGIIQPVTLQRREGAKYRIIAGERRWRAAALVGLHAIPAYIRTADDESIMEMALVENIQREDLNAIEIALAYEHLAESTGMTQERIAERVGKSRTAVANYIRLLRLPAEVQMALKNKEIDMGHARALLAVDSPGVQLKLFRETVRNGWSVRKVEATVRALTEDGGAVTPRGRAAGRTPGEYGALRDKLQAFFHTDVRLSCSAKGKGTITIPFRDDADLERLMAILDSITDKEQQHKI